MRLAPWYERHGRHLPVIAASVLAVLVGVSAAQLVWTLLPTPDSAVWRPAPVPTAVNTQKKSDGGAIAASHLFGIYTASAPISASVENAPDTHLNLTLMGIFAGTTARESRALIAQQGGAEEPHAIGDDVARGVTLQAIFPDRVILQRDGRLETLRLERDKPGSSEVPYQPLAADTNAAAGSVQELAKIRDLVLKDPSKASEYIRVQPANQSGQLRGYRVYPGRDRSVFNTAGLRPGDLVTAVNGVELNDAGRALQLLGELAQTTQLNLTIERGGQSQSINLSLN